MEYIISEEELKKIFYEGLYPDEVRNFFKDRQPVEQYELTDDTTIYTTKGRVSMCFKSKIYIQAGKEKNV